jgi:hypothetical protein
MYSVRFLRADEMPDEVYYYNRKLDAVKHFALFKADDSGLYHRIDLALGENGTETTLETIYFE